MHSFAHPFTHSFIHSFTHSFIHSFIQSFIHSFIHPVIQSFSHSFIHSSPWFHVMSLTWRQPVALSLMHLTTSIIFLGSACSLHRHSYSLSVSYGQCCSRNSAPARPGNTWYFIVYHDLTNPWLLFILYRYLPLSFMIFNFQAVLFNHYVMSTCLFLFHLSVVFSFELSIHARLNIYLCVAV